MIDHGAQQVHGLGLDVVGRGQGSQGRQPARGDALPAPAEPAGAKGLSRRAEAQGGRLKIEQTRPLCFVCTK